MACASPGRSCPSTSAMYLRVDTASPLPPAMLISDTGNITDEKYPSFCGPRYLATAIEDASITSISIELSRPHQIEFRTILPPVEGEAIAFRILAHPGAYNQAEPFKVKPPCPANFFLG